MSVDIRKKCKLLNKLLSKAIALMSEICAAAEATNESRVTEF